ncbi:hypothetical protein NM208_g1942 [Fusarium decemcellulare]|uniref:Uncharacterized protein n=1 Tax=Fusarium decemcellulare TaxID=57161 RepID=A0ACC1SUF6_9HYPO|nr:hypothetical protein NM208_g1942 [Fusarium decemcellulare]
MPYTIPEAAQPFTLRISDNDCSQLRELLELFRLGPSTWENQHQDGRYGIPHHKESRINSFPNYKIGVQDIKGDIDLHFIGLFSQKENAVPMVLLHGWRGSFLEFLPTLEILPKKYNSSCLPYHVIVPSLPGYTLSSGPRKTEAWNSEDAARVINNAVMALGFS